MSHCLWLQADSEASAEAWKDSMGSLKQFPAVGTGGILSESQRKRDAWQTGASGGAALEQPDAPPSAGSVLEKPCTDRTRSGDGIAGGRTLDWL